MADIFIYDDFNPEDIAMMQALYSRSPKSVTTHVEKVRKAGSGNFMEQYYVGYGHASIGDCGSTSIFIEDVSMLVAKAVQDSPLYSGQEASTRYLDFSEMRVVDPYNHAASKAITDRWMRVYNTYLPKVIEGLKKRYPFNSAEYKSEAVWEKTIKARAFDTMRSFLPIGTTTFVSWHTNLRQARDHVRHMANHPLPEVRDAAKKIHAALVAKYKNSFTGDETDPTSERYAARNAYAQKFAADTYFLPAERALRGVGSAQETWQPNPATFSGVKQTWTTDVPASATSPIATAPIPQMTAEQFTAFKQGAVIFDNRLYDADGVNTYEADLLNERPENAPLPRRLETYGQSTATFLLDFGSFRDLQRHRNCIIQSPLIDGRFGFHQWYLDELQLLLEPTDFADITAEIAAGMQEIADLPKHGIATTPMLNQYLFPMGIAGVVQMTHALPQMVYLAELRSSKTVHPTARYPAQQIAQELKRLHPTMALHADLDADSWTAKRGTQDITLKAG